MPLAEGGEHINCADVIFDDLGVPLGLGKSDAEDILKAVTAPVSGSKLAR